MRRGARVPHIANPRLVDNLLVVGIFVLSILAVPATPEGQGISVGELTPTIVVCSLISCGALWWRRGRPRTAWAVSLAATLAPLAWGEVGRGLPAAVAALYALAAYGTRRAAVVGAAVTMLAALVLVSRAQVLEAANPVSYAVVAWCGMAAALGDAVRSNRASLAAAIDRAQRAEQSAEEQARRRVVEERVRIARDLHDSVAHQVAVINVQAGVAEHLLGVDPARAAEALRAVQSASSETLTEMSHVVSLLRAADDEASRDPVPGPDDIARLVEGMRTRGEPVTWRHTGPALHVDAATGLHFYRIVQEALTNAARHGTGAITLSTRQEPGRLVLEVDNDVRPSLAGGNHVDADAFDENGEGHIGGGHGIVGMRERVALLGGEIEVGANGIKSSADLVEPQSRPRAFRVRVVLPVSEPA